MNTKKTATGKAKPQNLMMSDAEPEEKIDLEQPVGAVLAQLCAQAHEMQRRLTHLEAQQGQVAMYMPRTEIPLGRREVEAILREDSASWFECLDNYKRGSFHMNKGKVFCGQNYLDIAGHVSAGLKVMGATPPQ